jgi:hypothetical protein
MAIAIMMTPKIAIFAAHPASIGIFGMPCRAGRHFNLKEKLCCRFAAGTAAGNI